MDMKMQMAAFYQQCMTVYPGRDVEEEGELVKEISTRILRGCGVWCSTKPLAHLATVLVSARCLVDRPDAAVETITIQSLVPRRDSRCLTSWIASLCKDDMERVIFEGDKAILNIDVWMFSEQAELTPSLMDLCYQATFVLSDIVSACCRLFLRR